MPNDASEEVTIRSATLEDAAAVARIYNYYIAETVITFEEEPVTAGDMLGRMQGVWAQSFPWLVAELGGEVVGYAYAGGWKARSAYRFSAEVTVYLDHRHTGRGTGSRLYGELFSVLHGMGMHAVMGGIALPNEASVALHEKLGMQKVAHFRETGYKFGRWIDVGYWERILDRRGGRPDPEITAETQSAEFGQLKAPRH